MISEATTQGSVISTIIFLSISVTDEVRLLFHELVDSTPEERKRVLDGRQLTPDVRAEVESLLNYDCSNAQPFTATVATIATEMLYSAARENTTQCGPYRLVRLLGKGGMGAVYLGERTDGEIRQRVAVKLLSAEGDRPGWEERFLKERELLERAAENLRCPEDALMRRVTQLGRSLGSPWSQDEKFATLAAWLALCGRGKRTPRPPAANPT